MKEGIRIAAFASGPVNSSGSTCLFCVVCRKGVIEGMLSSRIKIDGNDATSKIVLMLAGSRFSRQVGMIALNGVALAGLNIVDTQHLERKLGIPVIVITRKKPDRKSMLDAIEKRFAGDENLFGRKKAALETSSETGFRKSNGFYFSCSAAQSDIARMVPYAAGALRIAHMAARACSTGESKGRI